MAWTVDGLTYNNRKKITVQNAYIDADLSNFTFEVPIINDTDIGGISNADGFDHRFTSSTGTLLKFERESFSITGGAANGVYWVKSNLTTAAATDIYIYFRATDTADGSDAANAWDANYLAVYHMNGASWNGTSGEIIDSKAYSNGTASGNATTTATNAKIFRNATFDGNTDYANLNRLQSMEGLSAATWSAWNRFYAMPANGHYAHPIEKSEASFGTFRQIIIDNDNLGHFRFSTAVKTTNNNWYGAGAYVTGNVTSIAINTWYYAVSRFTGSGVKIDVNGANEGSTTGLSGTLQGTTANCVLGAKLALVAESEWMNGMMDEVRFSNISRADAWIKFEYRNMYEADNELTWGANDTGVTTITLTDTMSLSDSWLRTALFQRTFTENMTMTDVFLRNLILRRIFTDSVTLSDTFTKTTLYQRIFNETVTLLDQLIISQISGATTYNLNLAEILHISDNFLKTVIWYRAIADKMDLSDNFSVSIQFNRTFIENMTLNDSFTRNFILTKIFQDDVRLSEAFNKGLTFTVYDKVTIQDLLIKITQYDYWNWPWTYLIEEDGMLKIYVHGVEVVRIKETGDIDVHGNVNEGAF